VGNFAGQKGQNRGLKQTEGYSIYILHVTFSGIHTLSNHKQTGSVALEANNGDVWASNARANGTQKNQSGWDTLDRHGHRHKSGIMPSTGVTAHHD
jgi:hypothetical protein